MATSIVDDVVEVGRVATILLLSAVLSYLSTHNVVGQAFVSTGRGCFFTLGTLHPIGRPVPDGGLTLMVANRLFCCYDMAYCFSPLLGQSNEREF
jgi:hypothetical protein